MGGPRRILKQDQLADILHIQLPRCGGMLYVSKGNHKPLAGTRCNRQRVVEAVVVLMVVVPIINQSQTQQGAESVGAHLPPSRRRALVRAKPV